MSKEEVIEGNKFEVGDRVTRAKINAFRYGKGNGVIVEITHDGRNKIKWDEVNTTGQQHSTIQSRFLVKTI